MDGERGTGTSWPDRLRRPGWVLLPQRLFLGATFVYAGLQKLSDPHYFATGDPQSVSALMHNFQRTSPIGPLVGIAASHAHAAGLLIALAEIAVGLGALFGLWTRVAAAGGALLSLSFLLTVSWHTRPYYYGSDIGFLVIWLPLIAVGSAGVLSLDAVLVRSRPADEPVLGRRSVLRYTGAAGVLSVLGLGAASAAVLTRQSRPRRVATGAQTASPTPSPTSAGGTSESASPSAAPAGALVATSGVPVGGAILVSDPTSGAPVQVLQPVPGRFVALSAVCTHAGCTVAWSGNGFACPCHGATYDASGKATGGPATGPLTPIPVRVEGASVVQR